MGDNINKSSQPGTAAKNSATFLMVLCCFLFSAFAHAADIPTVKAADFVKVVGANPADGKATTPVAATTAGGLHVNFRNNAGTEIGTSANPIRVDPTGTTPQPVTQSGTWTVQQGTPPWSVGGNVASGTTDSGNPVKIGGPFNTTQPTVTNGQRVDAQMTARGAQIVATGVDSFHIANITGIVSLPTGASTAGNQTTIITSVQLIDDAVYAINAALSKFFGVGGQLDDTSTTAATEDNLAPFRITAQRAIHTNLRNAAGTEVGTASNRLFVDSSPAANIVSTDNSTTATLGSGATFTGASFEDLLSYADVTIIVKSNVAGTLTVQWSPDGTNIDDTDVYSVLAGVGKQYSFGANARYVRVSYTNGGSAQGSFRLQTIFKRVRGKPSSHRIEDAIVANDDAELVKAVVTGKDPTGVYQNLKVDINGNLITTALTGFNSAFAFGDVTLAATTLAVVRRTAYTEPASQTNFSIKSASASDASAGTGARTVIVTYYDSTGAGPFTETVTMNGTTCVNSTTTTARYIEKYQVVTVGSTGSNVGILTLYTGTACVTTVGTIAATDNQTFWAHHYVATGRVCNITGVSVSHNGTTVGSGGVFIAKAIPINASNQVETQATDFIRLYGQSSTFARAYTSPVKVNGPARIILYVTPETSSSTVYRAAIDFFEP